MPIAVEDDTDRFSYILWRSLLNAPPLKELLPELLRTLRLSPATMSQITNDPHLELMPKTVSSQIELLLEVCQKYRCLIVLDNVDSIFQAGAQVGQYRAGYADYGDVSEIFPYLRSSKLGFADIHILIQQQWERLTTAEHQVIANHWRSSIWKQYYTQLGILKILAIGDLTVKLNGRSQGTHLD